MGRSRRRMKKTAAKVKVGVVKRKKNQKAKLPKELTEARPDVEKRLQQKPEWEEEATLTTNYAANQFVLDPNEGFGRNLRPAPLKSKEEREAEDGETFSDDDEIRAATGNIRKTGKAAPQPLTAHQKQIVQRLIDAHGEDVKAWFRDTKLNRMQHSEGKLRELLESFKFHSKRPEGDRHDFRAPRKPFKRL
ncbi:hypothetical protein MNEG_1701 [Monoraphidium neglectum]|uniref:Nucleolar protein 16 n=1 Tax=Monoraphidium neglectum TaxID=145388 RepID=A0A0D2NPB5_9CHLO|nr:hypothetical protein MNEG_1701 [Monoraphidium neglectum]KIZ06256.1 hypothetical protein MNEG_1701 [Monoraphidium neglectum]|eukprot:XP_013905275.1 hypothetical protein MNEG_1701 [Monoraphidium neglectum]